MRTTSKRRKASPAESAPIAGTFLESAESRREFIANLSHELRTPVTAIKGYAQTLKAGGLDDLKHRDMFVDTIERHADRLAALIEDLLRISHLTEHPTPRVKRTPLVPIARKVLAELKPILERARIAARVEAAAPLAASADPAQISIVFHNLIGNAVKHGRMGGSLLINLRPAGKEVLVSVEDDGPGIPPKDLPRVFDRFYRGRPAKSRPGAGLGLSIVQQIVVAHGGRVWAESRRRRGAAIRFTLPLAK